MLKSELNTHTQNKKRNKKRKRKIIQQSLDKLNHTTKSRRTDNVSNRRTNVETIINKIPSSIHPLL